MNFLLTVEAMGRSRPAPRAGDHVFALLDLAIHRCSSEAATSLAVSLMKYACCGSITNREKAITSTSAPKKCLTPSRPWLSWQRISATHATNGTQKEVI